MDTGKKIAIAIAVANATVLVVNEREFIGKACANIKTKFTNRFSK